MVQGRNVKAEINLPQTVEIPHQGKRVEVKVRISLINAGETTFVAHARSVDDCHFWHVFDEHQQEVQREKGKGKGGATGVEVKKGIHTYVTKSVAGGQGVHGERTLSLDARRLEHGHTYTVRGEIYGHPAEAMFVALQAPAPSKPKAAAKKAAPKKAARKKAAAKRKPAAKSK